MTCWSGCWKSRISETFKPKSRVGSSCVSQQQQQPLSSFQNTPKDSLPGRNSRALSAEILFIRSCHPQEPGGTFNRTGTHIYNNRTGTQIHNNRTGTQIYNNRTGTQTHNNRTGTPVQSNSVFQFNKFRRIARLLSQIVLISRSQVRSEVSESEVRGEGQVNQSEVRGQGQISESEIRGQGQISESEVNRGQLSESEINKIISVKLNPKMEHSELVKELSHIEKLTNQERLKLAHNRRKLQLKYWNQYEKLVNNSLNTGSITGNNKQKGVPFGKNNQQQQKMLEQHLQHQEKLRKTKAKNKPNVKFCNSIMLLEAAGRNDISEVRRLLQDGVDPDVANEDGLTALHQCCIDDNEEMMKLLIESGANVNSEDSEKWTPLHAASTCGHLHLVKHLIAKGANLLAVNAEGNMPYDICDEEATLDFIESEMAKRGVTQDLIEEIRALPETRMLEDMRRLEMEDGDLETRDKDGATYLHIASANGYNRVVEFLLDHHVATDVQDKDCWQPVHAAACWSHVEVLELLVGAGADLNARTKNNETPYAICEDLEIKERIIQLRSEQETKMKESGVKKLRRSVSSNSRTQSIRRTSQRDKQNATKRDAADEAAMLLSIATPTKDSSPSPTSDSNLEVGEILAGHQTSITSSEEETEIRSLPPWSQGRDSITELHMPDNIGSLRKSHNIPIETDSSSADESLPRLNNTNVAAHGINGIKERNELNRSLQQTGGTKFQNPLSMTVSNPLLTDTNANLPNPDISPLVDLPKIPNPTSAPSTGTGLKDFPKYEPPPSPTTSLKKFTGESVGMVGEDGENRRKCCAIV